MERITPKQQMLVIEKLYRSNDSITSTKKFNDSYSSSVGKIGVQTMYLNDFYRMLKSANFLRPRIKKIIKEITGQEVTIY